MQGRRHNLIWAGGLMLMILLAPDNIHARKLTPFTASFKTGVTYPVSQNVNYAYWQGMHFGGGFGLKFGGVCDLSCNFTHHNLPADRGRFDGQDISISAVDVSIRAISRRAVGQVFPFVFGGGGIATFVTGLATKSYSALDLGGGIEFPVNQHIRLFLQLAYFSALSKERPIILTPISVGLRF